MLENKDFLKLYDDVFDEEGKVKTVGRAHTKALIEACEQYSQEIDFGNKSTGFMNVENIKLLRNKLQETK